MGKEERIEREGDDPWDLPELKVRSTPWSELDVGGKIWRVTWGFLRFVLLIGFLYMFICSLDFLGTAFKLLGGKTAGRAFRETQLLSNPIAGLMIGVLVTVLVQSSSTSTSIVITMVGANLLTVAQAVFIIMGANIGTTVTNTIVSLAQAREKNEFRRAFGAATVHDMFNWLTVIILLPIEWAGQPLQRLTQLIIDKMHLQTYKEAKKDILKVITKPFTKLVIKIDKKVITSVANAKDDELKKILGKDILVTSCSKEGDAYNLTQLVETKVSCSSLGVTDNVMDNVTNTVTSTMATVTDAFNSTLGNATCSTMVNETDIAYKKIKYRCDNLFALPLPGCSVNETGSDPYNDCKLSDGAAGGILLVVAIIILCICLACIVKLLQSIFQGPVAKTIRKVLNNDFPGKLAFLTGYVAILVGAGLTIIVQSSSIFTSTLTPLVGVGVIKLERMYPLTLGSNIGTTTTGILAALASDGDKLRDTLQLALCHLFFNIIGIIIWYPIPQMRKLPIYLAKGLGNTTANYRWFALVYLFLMFFIFPAVIFGLSLAGWYVLLAIGGPILLILIFVVIINLMQAKCPSSIHPAKLQTWQWLPEPLRSLRPLDSFFRTVCCRCACCRTLCPDVVDDDHEIMETGTSGSLEQDNHGYMIAHHDDLKAGAIETSNGSLSKEKDNLAFEKAL